MCKSKHKCTACEELWMYLHSFNAPEPLCENCPYDDIEEDIDNIEEEVKMYA